MNREEITLVPDDLRQPLRWPQHPVAERSNGLTNLGFLTVLHEASGYLGGYLVTNTWGRPLEFRLSSAVQPNRVQQILYGDTLQPYICADLIGKTLVDKAGVAVQLIVTDREVVLDLRLKLGSAGPLAGGDRGRRTQALAHDGAAHRLGGEWTRVACSVTRASVSDVATARELLARLDSTFDLAEPFSRIREAIGEARKMGVASR